MSQNSAALSLPFIMPSQAQKHVTHNEALARLDVLVQLTVRSFATVTPPQTPSESEAHVVAGGATGAFAGHEGEIAACIGGGWVFLAPRPGWIAVSTTGELRVFTDAGWTGPATPTLSVGAGADSQNRLVVSGESTLFTHEGGDHRLTINKAATAATGSLVFQSDWSGRAEMGLAGEDAWSIKVSADGSTWITALRVDPATGTLSGAAIQSAPDDTTEGRLMRADYGYGPGNLLGDVSLSGGTPTGAVIQTGANADGRFTRFADGTQICTGSFSVAGVSLTTALAGGFAGTVPAIAFPAPFVGAPSVSATLSAGTQALVQGFDATSTQADLRLWSGVSGGVTVNGRLLAIGRWA